MQPKETQPEDPLARFSDEELAAQMSELRGNTAGDYQKNANKIEILDQELANREEARKVAEAEARAGNRIGPDDPIQSGIFEGKTPNQLGETLLELQKNYSQNEKAIRLIEKELRFRGA
jgi:hypothetical protein